MTKKQLPSTPRFKIGETVYFVETGSDDSGDPENINFTRFKRFVIQGFYPSATDPKFYLIGGDYQYPKTMCFTREEALKKFNEWMGK